MGQHASHADALIRVRHLQCSAGGGAAASKCEGGAAAASTFEGGGGRQPADVEGGGQQPAHVRGGQQPAHVRGGRAAGIILIIIIAWCFLFGSSTCHHGSSWHTMTHHDIMTRP